MVWRETKGVTAHPEGCIFLATVSYPARPRAAGVFDRLVVRRAVARKLRTAGKNLARLAAATTGMDRS